MNQYHYQVDIIDVEIVIYVEEVIGITWLEVEVV